MLAALEETEGALVTRNRSQQQAQALFDAAVSAERAANIARERFKVGISDFLAVLDAERELLTARNQLGATADGGGDLAGRRLQGAGGRHRRRGACTDGDALSQRSTSLSEASLSRRSRSADRRNPSADAFSAAAFTAAT